MLIVDGTVPRIVDRHIGNLSGGTGSIATRGQIYMGAPIGVVEIAVPVTLGAARGGRSLAPRPSSPLVLPPPLCTATG